VLLPLHCLLPSSRLSAKILHKCWSAPWGFGGSSGPRPASTRYVKWLDEAYMTLNVVSSVRAVFATILKQALKGR
jgi:hypothetical protein